MMRQILIVGALGLLLVLFSGCSSYSPDKRSPELAPAIVRTTALALKDDRTLITVQKVDGEEARPYDAKLLATPDVHVFDLLVELRLPPDSPGDSQRITKVNTSLTFETEANGEYLIDAKQTEQGVFIWAIDQKTGHVVAGTPPPK